MLPSISFSVLALAGSILAAPTGTSSSTNSTAVNQWLVQHTGKPTPGSAESIKNLKDKIKQVVLIVMENRSLDNLLGGQTLPGLDNPYHNGPFCSPMNVTDPTKGMYCTEAKDTDEIPFDPDHSMSGYNMALYGTYLPNNTAIQDGTLKPDIVGYVQSHLKRYGAFADAEYLAAQVMNYYTEDQVPVITELTQNFAVMNNWHSGIPGPTAPNRLVIESGTSLGIGTNMYWNYTQRSIFQQLAEQNLTWTNYYAEGDDIDAQMFEWTLKSPLYNSSTYLQEISMFYQDAYMGNLPTFSFIDPTCCESNTNSMHPIGKISNGELYLKTIYDAVRQGPQWNSTLFIITFDETGGFYDHVPPPLAPRPDNLTWVEETPAGNYTFDFDRLGGRIPTWIVSPWVDQGFVEKEGLNAAGDVVSYSAESILRTLGYLWDFEPFNPRIEHAPSFDHLIGTKKQDAPYSMPIPTPF